MIKLSELQCEACQVDTPKVSSEELVQFMKLIPYWTIIVVDEVMKLERVYQFKNFKVALEFTNILGELAESEFHHPAILTEWGKVTVTWWSHSIGGLHKNDFIMAAKTDELIT